MSLEGRHILLGITGSIAAYKAAILCRLLKGAGAEVKVVMTPLAKQFITPLTMATLSKHPILVEFFNPENGEWNSHVSLGEWADCLLIAPATANTLGKMAHGIADNLLLTTYLSARCPVAVAPAMDLDMFAHSATQENLRILRSRGVRIVEPAEGELASGLSGKGRMAEPADIVAFVEDLLSEKKKSLRGKRLIVTAGATIEAIDPVRFISNHSSGKMGYAIACDAARRGADVILVSGPTALAAPRNVTLIPVESTQEMLDACLTVYDSVDAVIKAAAVADYRPHEKAAQKIKKNEESLTIDLDKNPDILKLLGEKKTHQFLVGFAAETQNLIANAAAKVQKKHLDMIVANDVTAPGAGFSTDTNIVKLLFPDGSIKEPGLMSKEDVGNLILDIVRDQTAEK